MWLIYAALTILGSIGLDFFIKKASGKIDDYFGMVIINLFALLPASLIYFWLKLTGKTIFVTKEGVTASIVAGILIGFASITLIKMFAAGTNLSVGTPLVRIATVIGVILLGTFLLKEALSIKQIVGLALAISGLLLLIIK
jgi:EamA domain-containing membrane protein RarD